MQQTIEKGDVLQRIAGIALIVGAIVLIVSNALFPRADDPGATREVLTKYGENETLAQVAYLGIAVGIWLFLAGLAGVYRSLSSGAAAAWARVGFYGALVGAAMWTVTAGMGLGEAGAAANWVAALGTPGETIAYSVAAALYAAAQPVFTMTVIAYWVALIVLSIGISLGTVYPRWLGWIGIVLGVATVITVAPQAFQGITQTSQLLFAIFAGLSTLWGLVIGVLITRKAW